MLEIVKYTDLVLLIISLGSDDALEQIETIKGNLEEAHIHLVLQKPKQEEEEYSEDWLLKKYIKMIIVGNKSDLEDAAQRLEVLRELYTGQFPLISISAETGNGLTLLKEEIYKSLDIIRVYTKAPSKPVDKNDPIILERGSTVIEAAEYLHKDFANNLKFARIWGKGKYDGQRVSRDEILEDEDIVEFHI